MYTVCPKCALPLAVTAADLRAGQGYVRCGRCANVFNALLALSEESDPAAAARAPGAAPAAHIDMGTASATMSRPALSLPEAEVAAEAAPQPAEPAPPNPWAPPALRLIDSPPRPAPPALASETFEAEPAIDLDDTGEFRGTSTFETIILEGDTFLQTQETIPEEVMASELADVSRRIAAAHSGVYSGRWVDDSDIVEQDENDLDELDALGDRFDGNPPGPAAEPAGLAALREATGEFRHEANLGVPAGDAVDGFQDPRRWPGWRMSTAAGALGLILAVQAINHWRDDLATHRAWYGAMRNLASMLGEPLYPNWDLNAYDVRQLGAAADSPDNHMLRVRLRLVNVGLRTQGLPLLRLTLLDRYGKAVSKGELQPAQYLPPELRGQQFIARDQRIDTEVQVLDPSQQASSFELDVCVSATGGLRCASDTPTVAGHS